jgi:hypothetical protein
MTQGTDRGRKKVENKKGNRYSSPSDCCGNLGGEGKTEIGIPMA